ncbi:MAG: hypothetical protein LBT80_01650 [Lactobacillaceae bacterium]|nr:hypothetical protein [Lactobacillaceae bacterium]
MADKQLSFFDVWTEFYNGQAKWELTSIEKSVFYELLGKWNSLGRPNEFKVTGHEMEILTGHSIKTVRLAEDKLMKLGVIEIEKGRVGRIARKIKWVVK